MLIRLNHTRPFRIMRSSAEYMHVMLYIWKLSGARNTTRVQTSASPSLRSDNQVRRKKVKPTEPCAHILKIYEYPSIWYSVMLLTNMDKEHRKIDYVSNGLNASSPRCSRLFLAPCPTLADRQQTKKSTEVKTLLSPFGGGDNHWLIDGQSQPCVPKNASPNYCWYFTRRDQSTLFVIWNTRGWRNGSVCWLGTVFENMFFARYHKSSKPRYRSKLSFRFAIW